jgi:hypothetical protein
MKPILYPVQLFSSLGRAKGFKIEEYLPWSALPTQKQTIAWNGILSLYARLAAAYDHFYQELGFLSPEIQRLVKQLQRTYTSVYLTDPLPQYAKAYISKQPNDIAKAYSKTNYPAAYANLLINPRQGETING